MEKTFVLKGKPEAEWVLVDASGQNLGRLAGDIANVLLGKNKPTYTPGVVMGDYVVVINAEKIVVSPKRMEEKVFYSHSNYPGGLKENEIPIECRILAIVDAYDAMTSTRPYRAGLSPEQAIQEIERCAGTQFEPELAKAFIEMMSKRLGTKQLLEPDKGK